MAARRAWRLRQRAREARAADERQRLRLADTLARQHLDRLAPADDDPDSDNGPAAV